ncbi:MAG: helix-hairpin-helix domain-containing protein [Patescibacteria group bacterium]|jgi:competence protein ComEA
MLWFSGGMNIELSKNKIVLFVFFIIVFLCLAVGIYFDRKRREQSEVALEESPEQDIFADISGAVSSPGVYKLPYGSRVTDLLRACGGALDNASVEWLSKNLNLSDKLQDSEKIYIPFDWEVQEYTSYKLVPLVATQKVGDTKATTNQDAASTLLVNVNTASQDELEELPGIGEVTAKRIIENRPYEDLSDLSEKASLSSSVAEKIVDLVNF